MQQCCYKHMHIDAASAEAKRPIDIIDFGNINASLFIIILYNIIY